MELFLVYQLQCGISIWNYGQNFFIAEKNAVKIFLLYKITAKNAMSENLFWILTLNIHHLKKEFQKIKYHFKAVNVFCIEISANRQFEKFLMTTHWT